MAALAGLGGIASAAAQQGGADGETAARATQAQARQVASGHLVIKSHNIAKRAVRARHVSSRAIRGWHLADASIGRRHLRDRIVGRAQLRNRAVGAAQLDPGLADGAPGEATLRSLGSGPQQAVAGNDERLLVLPGTGNLGAGPGALESLGSGHGNTAVGVNAGSSLTSGFDNTLVGELAGDSLTTGGDNTLVGELAGVALTTGFDNSILGELAGAGLTTGEENVLIGELAAPNLQTGSGNIALGSGAGGAWGTEDSDNIAIGSNGVANESDTIRIGTSQSRTFIAGIRGTSTGVADAIPVLIDSNGQLGTVSSSRSVKRDITGLTGSAAARAVARLRPVSFRYTADHAPGDDTVHFGLIAEQVAKVLPELAVMRNGKPETVAYHELSPLLLAEVQRQRGKLGELRSRVERQDRQLRSLSARLARLEAKRR